MDWVWMKNAVTGGVAKFPAGVQEAWTSRGWAECPEPREDDGADAPVGVESDPESVPDDSADSTEAPAQPKPANARGQMRETGNG